MLQDERVGEVRMLIESKVFSRFLENYFESFQNEVIERPDADPYGFRYTVLHRYNECEY